MPRTGRKKAYQFVKDLERVGRDVLAAETPLPAPQAFKAMRSIVRTFCALYARNTIYIPLAIDLSLNERDDQILAAYGEDGPDGVRKFTGERVQQLAFEHKITAMQVYNIIRHAKRRDATPA